MEVVRAVLPSSVVAGLWLPRSLRGPWPGAGPRIGLPLLLMASYCRANTIGLSQSAAVRAKQPVRDNDSVSRGAPHSINGAPRREPFRVS